MSWIAKLVPFLLLGVAIVAFAFGLMLLTYLLFFGAIVGLFLFAINLIKQKFFTSREIARKEDKKTHRVIDHKD